MTFEERRRDKRVKGDIAISINDAGSNMITEAKDISVSGICCKTNKPVAMMTRVVITLLLPVSAKGKKKVNKLKCEGIVVRSEPIKTEAGAYEVAIFFDDLPKNDKKLLEKYVDYIADKDEE